MFERAVAAYVFALKAVLFLLAAAMVGMVFVNLVLRYGFSSGISAAEELSRWALVWAGFVGATVALIERGHLSTRILIDAVPRPVARILVLISQAASLATLLFLLTGVWAQVGLNMSMRGPITGLPIGAMLYGAGLFFAANACVIIPIQMVAALKSRATQWQVS